MVAVKRLYIDIDWSKMQILHSKIDASHVRCMKTKWNPFRDDWEQGFDSDCCGHCSEDNYCFNAFYDKNRHKENHFKPIIIEFEEKPCWNDKEVYFFQIN